MYPDMSRDEREKLMAAQCLKTEVTDFKRTLSDDDVSAEENAYARNGIQLAQLEAELKEITGQFKGKIKAVKEIMAEALKVIDTRKRNVNGKLYLFPDHQANKMRYYDVWGELINTRDLRVDERQTRLFIGENGESNKHIPDDGNGITDTDYIEIISDGNAEPATGEATSDLANEPAADQAKTQQTGSEAGADKGKKRPAKRKQTGDDINEKVAAMTDTHKKNKSKIKNALNSQAAGEYFMPNNAGVEVGSNEPVIDADKVTQIINPDNAEQPAEQTESGPADDDGLPE
jgi:hypothetical protein